MSAYLTPDESAVTGKLQFLYGDELKVSTADQLDVDKAICAIYVSPEGKPVAAALCDMTFGCYAGASLSMIPANGAHEAAQSGEITQSMLENLYEVLNICANLLMNDSTPHLKLHALHASFEEASEEAKALIKDASAAAFKVDIPRYGSGVLSLMS